MNKSISKNLIKDDSSSGFGRFTIFSPLASEMDIILNNEFAAIFSGLSL